MEPQPESLTKEELLERQYRQKRRELKIARTRASVLRKQITEAYEIVENIRFDYLGDTAFRDEVVRVKKGLESALSDFLLSDSYWERAIEKHSSLSPLEYDARVNKKDLPPESSK